MEGLNYLQVKVPPLGIRLCKFNCYANLILGGSCGKYFNRNVLSIGSAGCGINQASL